MYMKTKSQLTAPEVLDRELSKSYPLTEYTAMMLNEKETVGWPDWCYLPMSVSFALITHGDPDEHKASRFIQMMGISNLLKMSAILPWRVDKAIYEFTSLDNIQDEFTRLKCVLPYPCVYITNPPGVDDCDGVFFFWEWDSKYPGYANIRGHYLFADGTMKAVDKWFPKSPVRESEGISDELRLDVLRYNQCKSGFDFHLKMLAYICRWDASIERIGVESKRRGDVLAIASRPNRFRVMP